MPDEEDVNAEVFAVGLPDDLKMTTQATVVNRSFSAPPGLVSEFLWSLFLFHFVSLYMVPPQITRSVSKGSLLKTDIAVYKIKNSDNCKSS